MSSRVCLLGRLWRSILATYLYNWFRAREKAMETVRVVEEAVSKVSANNWLKLSMWNFGWSTTPAKRMRVSSRVRIRAVAEAPMRSGRSLRYPWKRVPSKTMKASTALMWSSGTAQTCGRRLSGTLRACGDGVTYRPKHLLGQGPQAEGALLEWSCLRVAMSFKSRRVSRWSPTLHQG